MIEPTWRKSCFSVDNNCVEVAEVGDDVRVRNSNDPDAGTLTLSRPQVAAWIAGIKAGEYDDLL